MPDRKLVVLADDEGHPLGTRAKRAAHEAPGELHLAFSVFLFRGDGRTLVQQRAATKYHFAGTWANACCSHPEPGEAIDASARRRVREELGLDCALEEVGRFVYRAVDGSSGLVEHEYDHVLVGMLDDAAAGSVRPDPEEVQDWRWVDPAEVAGAGGEEGFAPWFAESLALALRGWRRRSG
ncbi:MAG TPA: isopentenyl-diphosphate Delta-isomerase [Acidimicrobiales bacterium]|nr:isopentenyl-diphosphate Delta-isomerase [Acidimicrobiales bacterium]